MIRPAFDIVFRSAYLLFGPQKVNIQPKVQKLEKSAFFKIYKSAQIEDFDPPEATHRD